MKRTLLYLWRRRTTTFGYVQAALGVLALSDGIFGPQALKYIVLANGLMLALLGHHNNRKQKVKS